MKQDMGPEDDRTQSFVTLAKGTEVGHYRIIEKIGAGGMGEVYLAEDTKLNRRVALKFLPPHLCQDEECRKRFTREAQAAAGLDHPNIAGIYEVGEYQGRPFYSMQVIEGQSLKDIIAGKDLPIDRILEIAIQVCEGLQAAHEKGIIHRDIKPSNILLDSHGRVRIVDFGLASIRGSETLTRSGSTLGTIGYMSPEQVQGKEIDKRSDLFSLGVVLYELITKQNPFKRDNEAATLKAVAEDSPHPLARYRADVPEGLQAVIDKALEKDVKIRYQHADGMLSDLMRIKQSLQSLRPIPSTIGKSSRPLWLAVTFITIAAVALSLITRPWRSDNVSQRNEKIMLAVLPFENLGDPADEYFADGMTEELIGKLARLSGLGVISRTSSMQYKAANKNIRQIGKELGVEYVIEGTVRWVHSGGESQIRVQPQLIRVEDDVHIWADSYDGVFEDVLALQSRIAISITEALDLSLAATEKDELGRTAEVEPEAYQLYLKGSNPLSFNFEDRRTAIELLSQAVERDPNFAAAHAALAEALIFYFREYGETDMGSIEEAREHAERAIALEPQAVDGYIAMSDYLLWVNDSREEAFDYLDTALSIEPDNAEALTSMGQLMFMEGNFQASYHFFKRAITYDPVLPRVMFANVLLFQRKWDELIEYTDAVLATQPDNHVFQYRRAEAIGEKYLSVDSFTANMPPAYDTLITDPWSFVQGVYVACINRDYDLAESMCRARLQKDQTSIDSTYNLLSLAWIHNLRGDGSVNSYAESAIIGFEAYLEIDSISVLMNAVANVYLALAYAFKGDSMVADSLCRLVLDHAPLNDQASLATILNMCATTYVVIGKEDEAIGIFEELLSRPSNVSLFSLKYWPWLDPLHDNPRFQALIKKYERVDYGI